MEATQNAFEKFKEKAQKRTGQSHIQKENEEKSDGLGQAKDRAQLTANSAMSVVQIALLKEVFVLGPENNKYYMFMLVLIISSLVLQIISGLIALLVGHLRVYYSKNQEDALDECMHHICCCGCVLKTDSDEDEALTVPKLGSLELLRNGEVEEERGAGIDGITELEFEEQTMKAQSPLHMESYLKKDARFSTKCCPCKLTTMIYDEYEYHILDAYEDWKTKASEFDREAAESKIQLQYLQSEVKAVREQHDHLVANKDNYTSVEFSRRTDQIQAILAKAQRKKDDIEIFERKALISRSRGEVLYEKAKSIRKNQLLKRASLWQNTLNYIYFIVFVLNGFITGFGVVGVEYQIGNLPVNATAITNATTAQRA